MANTGLTSVTQEETPQQQAIFQGAQDPNVADALTAWSSAAPTLSPHILQGFANAGIGPNDPLGQWIIQSGVPALSSNRPVNDTLTESQSAAGVLGDPQLLAQLRGMPLDKMTKALKMSTAQVGALQPDQLTRLEQTGSTHLNHSIFNKIGDIATTGVRDMFTQLAAPAQAIGAAYRGAELNPWATGFGLVLPAKALGVDIKGKGGLSPMDIANQTQLGQAVFHNQGLGSGFLPGGPATQAMVKAQQASASIDGHALTPGRALAAVVTEPGTWPYRVISGATDFTVAMKADPSAHLLNELSDAYKGSRVFTATSEDAKLGVARYLTDNADAPKMAKLEDWAFGADSRLGEVKAYAPITDQIVAKLSQEPGSLSQLVDQGLYTHEDIARALVGEKAGLVNTLRQSVAPRDAMSYLNSDQGTEMATKIAEDNSFTHIRGKMPNAPVQVVQQLADATNPDEVKQILGGQLGMTINKVPSSILPYSWQRPFSNLRWAALMPDAFADGTNPDSVITQAERYLQLSNVPRSQWDQYLTPIAKADNWGARYDAFVNGIYGGAVHDSIANHLGNTDAANQLAKTFTTAFGEQSLADRQRWIGTILDPAKIPGGSIDGMDLPIEGPHRANELLNSAIPALADPRQIRRLTAPWAKAYEVGAVNKTMLGIDHFSDFITNAFKIGALAKLALPVRFLFDEQARMAAAGFDSMFHHPLSYMAWVTGKTGGEDMLGHGWDELLADTKSQFTAAIGRVSTDRPGVFEPDKILTQRYGYFQPQDTAYVNSWADSLSRAYADAPTREVARALRDPFNYTPAGYEGDARGLEAVKEWFATGAGQKYRQELADGHLWGGQSARLADDPNFANQYIESLGTRLLSETNSHDALINAVADGTPFRTPSVIDPEFKQSLAALRDAGESPALVRGQLTMTTQRRAFLDHAVNKMFSWLMDKPSGEFTRSPMFRQAYFQDMQRLMPFFDEATQSAAIEHAGNIGVMLTKPSEAQGAITLAQGDKIAQANALGEAKKLLYYHATKSNAADSLRAVFPFANAWKSVISSWARLTVEHPQIVRRVQQGVTEAQQSGFFYKDPQSGNELFTILPAGVMQSLAGVPFPMVGQVKGLNIVGQGIPGFGPAIQWPASFMLSHLPASPVTDFTSHWLFPTGQFPNFSGGIIESLFPGWLNKLRTSGWMSGLPGGDPSWTQSVTLKDVAKQAADYLASTGNYDLHTQAGLDKLAADSMNDAKRLYFWRGLAQSVVPAAPDYQREIRIRTGVDGVPQATLTQNHLKDGQLLELWKVSNDYKQMLNATQGDSYSATLGFVNKWGPDLVFATQPLNRRMPYALPTTAEADIWRSQHSDFAAKYPVVASYFAPQGGQFSYLAYLHEIQSGAITTPSVQQWLNLADARLGNTLYSHYRSQMGTNPTQDQTNLLAQIKETLTQQYPGFNQDATKASYDTLDQLVTQLIPALNDKTIAGTPLAAAARTYVSARQQALRTAQARAGSATATLGRKDDADLRNTLYEIGTRLANQTPAFTTMWNDVFSREVDPNGP